MPELVRGTPLLDVVLRLVCAVVIGGVVGWERERLDKPAGFRTHILVSLGSATFMLLGVEVGEHFVDRYGTPAPDPTRVLQGVVGGIGFLGAGAIIKSSGQVTGMTTAASVWIAGALGAGAGMGAYLVAVIATVLALVTLMLLPMVERNRSDQNGGSPTREAQDTQRDSDPKPTSV